MRESLRVQERWLTLDLAAVDRTRTPWVLVNFHNPWYTTDLSFKVRGQVLCHAPGRVSVSSASCVA